MYIPGHTKISIIYHPRMEYHEAKKGVKDDSRESFASETTRRLRELSDFMARWHDLPAQRSPQWHSDRTFSIGASEIATLLGRKLNPYETIRTLIMGKAGLKKFKDKTAMNLGCVLERVVTMLAEKIFDCHIEEMGSIPTSGMRYQRSSPDGVAVVPCLGNLIVSFEFKAPKNRIPRGTVPAYYRPQVLTCLCAVEPSDLGIFIDCAIRRSSVEEWRFDSCDYDYTYHKDVDFGEPLALSLLYFYDVPTESEEKKVSDVTVGIDDLTIHLETMEGLETTDSFGATASHIGDQREWCVDNVINLGTCSPMIYDDTIARVCDHTMRVEYHKIIVPAEGQPDYKAEVGMRPGCVGILPIKIMRCVVCPVKKDPTYILQFQSLIDEIIAVVHIIMDAPEASRPMVLARECDAHGWTDVPYEH